MPKSTTRTAATIVEEITNVQFHRPAQARQWRALQILKEQETVLRNEYLTAFAACGSSVGTMATVDVLGLLHASAMSEYPRLQAAICILSESTEVQEIDSVLEPLTAELAAARAAEDAALQAAADAVTQAQAEMEAEVAKAQAEIEQRASLTSKKSRLVQLKTALAAMTGR